MKQRGRNVAFGLGLLGAGLELGCERSQSETSNAVAEDRAVPTPRKAEPKQPPASEEPGQDAPPVRKDGTIYGESELMGTRVSINVWLPSTKTPVQAKQAMQAALAEMARIEDIMSEWRPHSELSRLSSAAGKGPVSVSPELLEVLALSQQISEASGGAFDVTFHGVGQLWSFAPGARPPSKKDVAVKLDLVDYRAMQVDRQSGTVILQKPGMMIGLGAIAKGYAVDRASKVLAEHGFVDHVVEGGGDTYAAGTKNGKPWMIGVQNPEAHGTIGVIPISNEAVVTSGDYQRFFEYEGVRYSHILDPRTGWPVRREDAPKSVTLVGPDAATADAYCTAAAVLGAQKGMELVEQNPQLQAVIIEPDGTVAVSTGLQDRYTAAPSNQ